MKTAEEKLVAAVFDKTIEALGLMTKKLSDSIEKDKPSKRFYAACSAMNGLLAADDGILFSDIIDNEDYPHQLVKASFKIADELLKQEAK